MDKDHKENDSEDLTKYTNKFLKKMTDNLEDFSYNKIIANLHEMYSYVTKEINKKYKKEILLENYQKILISMEPIIPHFSNECLESMNIKNIKWPNYDESLIKDETINLVIQINGKKRGLIRVVPDKEENEILEISKNNEQINKYIQNNEIKKSIYVKNKL